MKTLMLSSIAVLVLTGAVAASNTPAAGQRSESSRAGKTITVAGCVTGTASGGDAYVLADATAVRADAQSQTPGDQSATAGAPTATPEQRGGKAERDARDTASKSYRLSGVDFSSWVGQRVQVTGTIVRSTEPRAGGPSSARDTTPEIRVSSVQPADGTCK